MSGPGTVYLVGAGPGDPELLTLRGAEVLGRAEVVVYDGLANPVLLDLAPLTAERVYAGKKHSDHGAPLTQAQIEAVLVDRARRGLTVVRLKGGDPFVFGRGGEEAETLAAAGIPFEIVPGVTAATAVPAYAGIPLTHRAFAATAVALTTGHEGDARPPDHVDWRAAAGADTVVLFMAVKSLAECVRELVAHGKKPDTPAAAIRWGTTAMQETIVSTLAELPVAAATLKPPALIVVGEVVRLRETIAWYEQKPLFGHRVLVPRQKEQARGFARALTALGGEPYVCEVTELVDADPAPLAAALAALAAGTYAWTAFTSANAVERTVAALLASGADVRRFAGVKLVAVGPATARALAAHGLRAELVPARGDGTGVAEALLAADPAVATGAARVLLPRAAEGREELVTALAAGGARVDAVAAYRTVARPAAALAPLVRRLRARELAVLAFFSPSQVDAVADALGADAAAVLSSARVIAAIGRTTADALAARGVRVDVTAAAPSAEALAAEIARFVHHRPSPPPPAAKEPR